MRFTTRANTGSIDNNKDTKWALTGTVQGNVPAKFGGQGATAE